MRVTYQTRMNTMLNDFERIQNDLYKTQRVLETGVEIEKPSDDPARAHQTMRLRSEINQQNQYMENMSDAQANLSYAESELMNLEDLLSEARALAIQGASGTYNDDDTAYLAERINQILHEVVATANARHEGTYIFGGFNTQEAPYQMIEDVATGEVILVQDLPSGMDGKINRIIEEGVEVQVNVPGTDLFQTGDPGDPGDMFQVLIDLRDGLAANDKDQIQNAIELLDESSELTRKQITRIGGMISRIQNTEVKVEDQNIASQTHLSEAQDADLAEWISKFQMQTIALETSQQIAAKVLTTTLMDFIR